MTDDQGGYPGAVQFFYLANCKPAELKEGGPDMILRPESVAPKMIFRQ